MRRVAASPRALAAAVALGSLALYASTLCRSVYWYDSAEYTAAAYRLGVPHPPGYPLYTLLAHLMTLLPLPVALSVNAFSALCGALCVYLVQVVCQELGARPLAAAGGGLALAVSPVFWFNSTIAEVYTPGLCATLGCFLLALQAARLRDPRLAWFAAGLGGLGMGLHYSLATCGIGLATLCLRSAYPKDGARPAARLVAMLASCGAVAALGACIYLYVVLRASADVVPNYASPASLSRLAWLVSGGNYYRRFGAEPPALDVGEPGGLAVEHWAPIALLAAVGTVALLRRRSWAAIAIAWGIAGNLIFFVDYGVQDRDVFFLPSLALLCVLSALAIEAGVAALVPRSPTVARLPLVLLPAFSLFRIASDYQERDLGRFHAAHDYAERLCSSLPHRAVIVSYTTPAEWKYHTVFAMYAQHVIGCRSDVVVAKNLGPRPIRRLLGEQRAVYLYVALEPLADRYRLQSEGDLIRIVGERGQVP